VRKGSPSDKLKGNVSQQKGIYPLKRLGQHFLRDPSIIEKIVALSCWRESDAVLEVGPGPGALTLPLARRVRHVVAVEKDPRMVAILAERLSREGIRNVSLIQADILRFDLENAGPADEKLQVAGNLPYNISSPFLEKLVEGGRRIGRAVLMLQSEFAERLTASPGTKAYGALTLWVRYHAGARRLLRVAPAAFHPRPRVDSMVLELDFERPHPHRASDDQALKRVLKAAFAHRRKTLPNSFTSSRLWKDPDAILTALEACRISPRSRAEVLELEDFLCLTSALELTKGSGDAN
jgi:16S rRNA (adenine1518-N6/adenine1519-N6)-dimethyltransferase